VTCFLNSHCNFNLKCQRTLDPENILEYLTTLQRLIFTIRIIDPEDLKNKAVIYKTIRLGHATTNFESRTILNFVQSSRITRWTMNS
jgi:hypothetical protein